MRPTKKIETKHGNKIEVKEYITVREQREIRNVANNKNVDMAQMGNDDDVQNKMFELFVTSVNGKTEKVVDEILDLPMSDLLEIMEIINESFSLPKKN